MSFAFVCGVLIWLAWSRRTEAIRSRAKYNKKKRDTSQGIFDFNASSYIEPLLSFWSLASNLSQIGSLISDGYVWNAHIIVMTYLITAIVSALVQFTLFQIMCFANFTDLPLRLHRDALSRNQRLWSVVAFLSLFDLFYLRFFPWINNELSASALMVISVCIGAHNELDSECDYYRCNDYKRIVESSPIPIAFLEFNAGDDTLCIKVLYEKISLHEVVIVSKEFAERANASGVTLTNIMIIEELEFEMNPLEAPPTSCACKHLIYDTERSRGRGTFKGAREENHDQALYLANPHESIRHRQDARG